MQDFVMVSEVLSSGLSVYAWLGVFSSFMMTSYAFINVAAVVV